MSKEKCSTIVLSGGVGGAKLVIGLTKIIDANGMTVIANTGDDFNHLGLRVCPDIDTLVYTLAGLNNPETGWGRTEETASFMKTLDELGEETWFFLGDKDVAMHVMRTRRLVNGETLTAITGDICQRLGLKSRILPMTDNFVPTVVDTNNGFLGFQDYFVRQRCVPRVRGFSFDEAKQAKLSPQLCEAINDNHLSAIIIAPSNPFISIDPILSTADIRDRLTANSAPVVAVSPIVNGQSIKGPTAKIMQELNIEVSAVSIGMRYADLLDGIVIDSKDFALLPKLEALGLSVLVTNTIMDSFDDKVMLANQVMKFCNDLSC